MYPALVTALTRLAATSRWSGFTSALSSAAGVTVRTLQDVLKWAKNNKGAAALITASLADAGISIAEFFRDENGKPIVGSQDLAKDMSKYARIGPAAIKMLNEVLSGDGDKLKLNLDSEAEGNEVLARVACAYIRDRVLMMSPGDDATASMLELHAAMQLFTNLPRSNVESLMSNRITPVMPYSARDMRAVLLAGM